MNPVAMHPPPAGPGMNAPPATHMPGDAERRGLGYLPPAPPLPPGISPRGPHHHHSRGGGHPGLGMGVLPVGIQLVSIMLVSVPLLMARRKERPRRQLQTWGCDVLRVVLAYGLSELLLALWFYASTVSVLEKGIALPGPPPGPPPRPESGHELHSRKEHKHNLGARFSQQMLMLKVLEIAPGMIIIYLLYMGLLRLGSTVYTWVFLSNDRNNSGVQFTNDKRDGFGFISGNYGSPIRMSWLAIQTVFLGLAVFVVRGCLFALYGMFPEHFYSMGNGVFGWLTQVNPQALKYFLSMLVFPYMLCSLQFLLTDYLVKYRRHVYGEMAVVTDGGDDGGLDPEMQPDGIELDDMSGEPHQGSEARHVDITTSTGQFPRVGPLTLAQDSSTAAEPLGSSVTEPSNSTVESEPSSSRTQERGYTIPSSLGVITASILNAAAANSTASRLVQRAEASQAGAGVESSQEEPPTYDDSQREHRELFETDRVSALRRAFVINQMKQSTS